MNLNEEATVDDIKAGMEDVPPAKPKPKKVKKVAKKVSKKAKSDETDAKPAKAKAKNGKSNGHTESEDGLITVAELAEEAGISPQSARVKLRAAELDRGEGRWKWEPNSKGLKSARKVLGLE